MELQKHALFYKEKRNFESKNFEQIKKHETIKQKIITFATKFNYL